MSSPFVIGDFGAECITPYSLRITCEPIKARMESGKPLTVTVNLSHRYGRAQSGDEEEVRGDQRHAGDKEGV